jgi:hypothetical protein
MVKFTIALETLAIRVRNQPGTYLKPQKAERVSMQVKFMSVLQTLAILLLHFPSK